MSKKELTGVRRAGKPGPGPTAARKKTHRLMQVWVPVEDYRRLIRVKANKPYGFDTSTAMREAFYEWLEKEEKKVRH